MPALISQSTNDICYNSKYPCKIYRGNNLIWYKDRYLLKGTAKGTPSQLEVRYTDDTTQVTLDSTYNSSNSGFYFISGTTDIYQYVIFDSNILTIDDIGQISGTHQSQFTSTTNNRNWKYIQLQCMNCVSMNVSNLDTSNFSSMNGMFQYCKKLSQLDLSNFNILKAITISNMFSGCSSLTELKLGNNFIPLNAKNYSNVFNECNLLTKITCHAEFKQWCWYYQDTIALPNAMRQEGTGTWQQATANQVAAMSAKLSTDNVTNLETSNVVEAASVNSINQKSLETDNLKISDVKELDTINLQIANLKNNLNKLSSSKARSVSSSELTKVDEFINSLELDDDGYPLGWFEDTAEVGSGTWILIDDDTSKDEETI